MAINYIPNKVFTIKWYDDSGKCTESYILEEFCWDCDIPEIIYNYILAAQDTPYPSFTVHVDENCYKGNFLFGQVIGLRKIY